MLASRMDLEAATRLCSIPGIDLITAWTILAELGSDMSVFASPRHAASWAGLCPGNHESGGKRLSNRTRKGNRWLRRAFCQAAWAATRKKNSYLAAFFYRKAGKHGIRKAIVATAHRLLVSAFCILRDRTEYREIGGDAPCPSPHLIPGRDPTAATPERTSVPMRPAPNPLYSQWLQELSFRRNEKDLGEDASGRLDSITLRGS